MIKMINKEINLYYCDHNDVIAERIGDILEDMGIFEFTPLVRRNMNLFGLLERRIDEVNVWYSKNSRSGGKVNIVLFLTKFIKGSLTLRSDLKKIKQMSKKRNVNIFAVVDDEFRREIDRDDSLYSWIYDKHVVYDVTNSCIIADTIDVARSMTMELVKQRYRRMAKNELPDNVFDKPLPGNKKANIYISSIANAYKEIPDYDCPSKFLLIFSVFKYIEHSAGKSAYSKCMEYLLKRSVKELLMNNKDLELSKACLVCDMMKRSNS